MSIRNALLSMAVALSAAGMAADAYAQWKVEKAYRQGPCSDDLKKFCARTKAGDGRIAKCMADHFRELRPACQGMVQAALDKQGKMATACKADAEKFCKGIRPGQGRILACLKSHQTELAPACAAEFNRAKK